MPERFIHEFQVGWSDLDANGHMRNSAYLDQASNTRMLYFQSGGFAPSEWLRRQMGPVLFRDELVYRRELHMLDRVRVTVEQAGASADGARFRIRNTFLGPDGELAATVTATGAWLDLATRKLRLPPDDLHALMRALPRTEDYQDIAR